MMLEYASNNSLSKYISKKFSNDDTLPFEIIQQIALQTANALLFLHILEIVWRDCSDDNILVFDSNDENQITIKISDFGI